MGYRCLGSLAFLLCVMMWLPCDGKTVNITSTDHSISALTVDNLLCENLHEPIAIDNTCPHLSWTNHSNRHNDAQTAYEIEIATTRKLLQRGNADIWKSGRVMSRESVMVSYGGQPLHERHIYYWRVRTWNRYDACSRWSAIHRFGIGINDNDNNSLTEVRNQFKGEYITTDNRQNTTPVLTKQITLDKVKGTYVIHINSLGYHELYVNGMKVGSQVLEPAVSQLDKRSLIVSYDLTHHLHNGTNIVAIWLGKGWYKQVLFHNATDTPVVRAELDEIAPDGTVRCITSTDNTWHCNSDGIGYLNDIGTWMPLQFGGEQIDARKGMPNLNRVGDAPVITITKTITKSTPQMFVGNTITRRLKPQSIRRLGGGEWMIDFGENITGWLSADFGSLNDGKEVVIRYADDYADSLQYTGEKDVLIASATNPNVFCNRFNHHAFRYMAISGLDKKPDISTIEALQIAANQNDISSFECSDTDLNSIHDMIKRTVRCLTFSGYMVDCPHLERMGYGGDGNSSTMTLQTLQDASSTYYNWLNAWNDAQDEDGGMPHVAPAGGGGGGPYWCGFIIQASWRAYINYGDTRMITRHYDNMQRWLEYVAKYSVDGLLQRWPDTRNRVWFLGDWLTPTSVNASDERSVSLVSNCFVSDCLHSMTNIAKCLGKYDDADKYASWRQKLNEKIHATFYNASDSTYATASPLDMSYAMNAGVIPSADIYNKVCRKLEDLSATKYGNHIAVGLVGVPIYTEWATRNNESQLMYSILKQRDYPGYLYMIDNHATTTWESWDRSRSRIHNCYNGIGTWFYQGLAGIVPDEDSPAYRHFTIKPQIPDGVDWVKAEKQTPYGTIRVEVRRGKITVEIPFGCTATINGKDYGSGTYKL